jgi:hypothetical protein
MLASELSFTEGKKVNLETRFSSGIETNASKKKNSSLICLNVGFSTFDNIKPNGLYMIMPIDYYQYTG